ncbi:Eco57I restriction-modification methylase domain-containing protein [Staphylococcus sp. SS87]|nr:Eco57I restriction-modification methylase domain-containing protein [Staphylococcus singaporensis]
MKNSRKKINNLISNYNLVSRENVIEFIKNNPENLSHSELTIIAEIVNNQKNETAAYYTSDDIMEYLEVKLPDFDKKSIRILEPSVGIGNILPILQKKYKNYTKVIIDVVDIDDKSLEICQILNKCIDNEPNFEINYINADFLELNFDYYYDLIIGNPPFLTKKSVDKWGEYSGIFNDCVTKNLSGFFVIKSLELSENIFLILPKYFLHNPDFKSVRQMCEKYAIKSIIDFGEKGFKGVLIETLAILINTKDIIGETETYSVKLDLKNTYPQSKITDSYFPNWLIYRNEFFDEITNKMEMDIFTVYRDRSITKKVLQNTKKNESDIRVLRSKNVRRDGKGIVDIENYDNYITKDQLKKYSVRKYLGKEDVYLCPNMTYYPRIIKKPPNCVTNGSIAILENKTNKEIRQHHLEFWNSELFTKYYAIARNYSTRSLNIDKNSIFYFGLIRDC